MIQLNNELEVEGAKVILTNVAKALGVETYGIKVTEEFTIETNLPDQVLTIAQGHPDWSYIGVIGTQRKMSELLDQLNDEFDTTPDKSILIQQAVSQVLEKLVSVSGKENIQSILNSLP